MANFTKLNGYLVKDTEARENINGLNNDLAVERARINELATLEEGSTTGDAELGDIRVAWNGKEYSSAGISVRTQVTNLNDNLIADGIYNIIRNINHNNRTAHGITWTWNNDTLSVSGTATTLENYTPYDNNSTMPDGLVAGGTYFVECKEDQETIIKLYAYVDGTLTNIFNSRSSGSFTIPTNATGFMVRFTIENNHAVSETLKPVISEAMTNKELVNHVNSLESLELIKANGILPSGDVNNINGNYSYLITNTNTYTNLPEGFTSGYLLSIKPYNQGHNLQIVYSYNPNKSYARRGYGTNWTDWIQYNMTTPIEQIINQYYNTYNITTSPTITTDDNGWLVAIDDETTEEANATDMTGAIMSMLTLTGYCHLGPGVFYISGGIDMPSFSTLTGCGNNTVVKLLQSTTSGYCVKMQEYCTLSHIQFLGNPSIYEFDENVGTRDCIHFTGNYDGQEGSTQPSIRWNSINNVLIRNFSGRGIYCHNTSISTNQGLYVSDTEIMYTHTGIDLDYYSEFNSFVNCLIHRCYYACKNNSGNNKFTSCTFHATAIAYVMDNSLDDKPNNAHGSMSCCTFCHSGSNTGSAITIKNVVNGFIFTACQIWYNSIDITDSEGIVFNAMELGRGVTGQGCSINVNGGGLIMFNGCVFMRDNTYPPQINISNNAKVKFDLCYGSESGNAITIN